jgi:hypothetical protein
MTNNFSDFEDFEDFEDFQFSQTKEINNESDSDSDNNIIKKHIIDISTINSINSAITDYIDFGIPRLAYTLKYSECNYGENIFRLKKVDYVLIKTKLYKNLYIYYVKKNNDRYTIAINYLTNKIHTIYKSSI